jgi:hypothetical protein
MHRCQLYTCIAGVNPNTGDKIDEWNCALAWTPILLIENANTNRGQTEALESFRNETVTQSQITNQILFNATQNRISN